MTRSRCVATNCGRYAAASTCVGSIFSVRPHAAISTRYGATSISRSNSIAHIPRLSLRTYFGLKEALEGLLGRPVDLVEPGAVRNPYLKASIEGSREPVFAA